MESFCRVVEHRSFAKAAQSLGVKASSISKNIIHLESELGQVLLIRTTRSMSLTDVGDLYYKKGKQILKQWRELENEVVDMHSSPSGLLRISLPKAIGQYFFSSLINDFMVLYPNINVELHFSHQAVSLVEDEFDIAIRTWKHLPDSRLYKIDLMPLQPILIASTEYVEKYGKPESIEELKLHKLLSFQQIGKRVTKWVIDEKEVLVDSHYMSNDYQSLLLACKKGIGIANMYSLFTEQAIQCGELVRVLPTVFQTKSQLSLFYKQPRKTSTKLHCFLEFIERHFRL